MTLLYCVCMFGVCLNVCKYLTVFTSFHIYVLDYRVFVELFLSIYKHVRALCILVRNYADVSVALCTHFSETFV